MTDIFKDLFVLEMANNHQGSVQHGLEIIQAAGELVEKHGLNAGVKLQYRDIDTFIHPSYKKAQDVKHIPRFMSTRLSDGDFKKLVDATSSAGMRSIVTPFDEVSVAKCLDHNVEILKVASCSADDWPLLECVAQTGKPVIFSTGGLTIPQVDNLVSFFSHKDVPFAIMHCVSIYPTESPQAQLRFMSKMKKRYPGITIGYSGHEAPANTDIAKVAVGAGADMLERHIGVPNPKKNIKLNAYSMNPKELDHWFKEVAAARQIMGNLDEKQIIDVEQASLLSLKRGVFAKRPIAKGKVINPEDVFFAMPCAEGQSTSGEFGKYRTTITASKSYKTNDAIYEETNEDLHHLIRSFLHQAKGMVNENGIILGPEYDVELSHHFGLENFSKVGCVIINLINREYCKKLIVVLPGQSNPLHMHKLKEETFQVLHGELDVTMNENTAKLKVGDMLLVERRNWHAFSSETGCIFEEVSTTHRRGDSYYADKSIDNLDPMQRKTLVDSW